MAFTLFAEEGWEGAALATIQAQAWTPGPGRWEVPEGSFVYDGAGRARIATSFPTVNLAYDKEFFPRGVQRIEMDVVDDDVMLVGRLDKTTEDDYYLAHFQDAFVHLYKVVGGVASWLATAPVVVTGTDVFGLQCSGTTIQVHWNGSPVASVTDATFATGTVGIKCYAPNRLFGPIQVFVFDPPPTSAVPTTAAPTTSAPTTPAPTTVAPTTLVPTTPPEPTFPPSTLAPTTPVPTTVVVTTPVPTTPAPTTPAPTTVSPLTPGPISSGTVVDAAISYVESEDLLIVRAWMEDSFGRPRTQALTSSRLTVWSEHGKHFSTVGSVDDAGDHMARFVVPQARLWAQHLYLLQVELAVGMSGGDRLIAMPVN